MDLDDLDDGSLPEAKKTSHKTKQNMTSRMTEYRTIWIRICLMMGLSLKAKNIHPKQGQTLKTKHGCIGL